MKMNLGDGQIGQAISFEIFLHRDWKSDVKK